MSLPEAEVELWRGHALYKSECCGSCGSHPSQLMEVETVEFICGICKAESQKLRPIGHHH